MDMQHYGTSLRIIRVLIFKLHLQPLPGTLCGGSNFPPLMTFVRRLVEKKGSRASTTPLYNLLHGHSVRCTLPKCELTVQKLMSAPKVFTQLCESKCTDLISLLLDAVCPGNETGASRPLKGKPNIAALTARLLVVHRHLDSIADRLAEPPMFCERSDVQKLLISWAFSPAHDPRTSAGQQNASAHFRPADIAALFATDIQLLLSIVDIGVADPCGPVGQIVDDVRVPPDAPPEEVRPSSSAEAPDRQLSASASEEQRSEPMPDKVRL